MAGQQLVIDGPHRGILVPLVDPLVTYMDETGTLQAYHRHSWTLLGRVIHLLSVHASGAEIDLSGLAGLLLSEDALAASGWLPAWR